MVCTWNLSLLGMLRQKDHEFKVRLSYIEPVQEKKKERKKRKQG